MATNRLILGILCLAFLGRANEPERNFLIGTSKKVINLNHRSIGNDENSLRQQILAVASTQLGVREATGKNDGKDVEAYLRYTGNVKGDPWCASFVSWVFGRAGLKEPITAWSPALFPNIRTVKTPMPADVFGIYFSQLKRIAHCGILVSQRGEWLSTIEGNTNLEGSREGDGVYRKFRHTRTVYQYGNWVKQRSTKKNLRKVVSVVPR